LPADIGELEAHLFPLRTRTCELLLHGIDLAFELIGPLFGLANSLLRRAEVPLVVL
jgi:hypothetical protein